MPQQLPLLFSYQASGRIWQLKADLATHCLGIEIRDSLQEASFAYVCPQQDKVIFEGLLLEDALLSNLLACHRGVLLMQQNSDLNSPEEYTTLAVDAYTQEVLWAVSHYRHSFFAEDESFGHTPSEGGEEEWSAIHLQQGTIRQAGQEEILALLASLPPAREDKPTLQLPVRYEMGDEHFKTVHDFIALYLQMDAVKSCEYLHVFDKMAISFYTAEGEKLANRLAVFDAQGNLLLHQVIADGLQLPGSETFLVWHQHLYFIENSSCLKGYILQ